MIKNSIITRKPIMLKHTKNGAFDIPTLEGIMKAKSTDYIVKDFKGEFYPCDQDIFRMTYEKV